MLPPGTPWPATGWPRGLTRRMCAPTGQWIPFGSPEPSAFTYSKSFNCSGEIPPGGLSVSGDRARGTPLRHRPHIFAANSSGSILSLLDCRKFSKPTTSVSTFLKTAKLPFRPSCSRLGDVVVRGVFPQDEEPWLAGLLVVRRIVLRTAANGGHADAVGVSEVHLGSRHGLAILHLHQRHPVLPPDFAKGISLGKQGLQPVAVARHRLRADGMQRHQDVIVSSSKAADPVLGRAGSGIADRSARCAAPSMNAPNDLNESVGTRSSTSSATSPGHVIPTLRQ